MDSRTNLASAYWIPSVFAWIGEEKTRMNLINWGKKRRKYLNLAQEFDYGILIFDFVFGIFFSGQEKYWVQIAPNLVFGLCIFLWMFHIFKFDSNDYNVDYSE